MKKTIYVISTIVLFVVAFPFMSIGLAYELIISGFNAGRELADEWMDLTIPTKDDEIIKDLSKQIKKV